MKLSDERFQKGIELLAHHEMTARLGGIHTLHNLARESPNDHFEQVVQFLCSFARYRPAHSTSSDDVSRTLRATVEATAEEADPFPTAPADVVTAVKVAAACVVHNSADADDKTFRLELQDVELPQIALHDINLANTDLSHAFLAEVSLENANLTNARLFHTDLSGATLINTNLVGAELQGADFADAELTGAVVTSATFGSKAVYHPADPRDTVGKADDPFVVREGQLYCVARGLTQEQLDRAVANPENPPILDGVVDAATGAPLVWNGEAVPGKG